MTFLDKEVRFVDVCQANGLFTCGTCSQYDAVMTSYAILSGRTDPMFTTLVYMTWICSDMDKFSIDDVRNILWDSFDAE